MNKFLDAACRLYHKKEQEGFNQLSMALINQKIYQELGAKSGRYDGSRVWFWGLTRWGETWSKREYQLRG